MGLLRKGVIIINEERCMMCGKYENEEPNFDTIKTTVYLNQITDIAEFVILASKCRDDVVVKSSRFAVDGKSIMGLYSLDLTKPLFVEFYGNVPCEVKEGMKKFIVD